MRSPSRRPRSRLEALGRVALYLPTVVVVSAVLAIVLASLLRTLAAMPALPLLAIESIAGDIAFISQIAFLGGTLLVTWLFQRFLDRASLAALGLAVRRSSIVELTLGFALGALLMTLVLAVELALGGYEIVQTGWSIVPADTLLAPLLQAFLFFLAVALTEEVIARGYVLQNLSVALGRPGGVIGSSVLFALGHLANPGSGLAPLVGVFVAGLLLATAYLVTLRLWLPIGLHWGWNFFQGAVYGFPVSGVETTALLRLRPSGHPLLTGGTFGPEASVVGVLVELLGITALLLAARRLGSRPWMPHRRAVAGDAPSP